MLKELRAEICRYLQLRFAMHLSLIHIYNVLRQGVESISSLINIPGFINLDFADVRSIMKDAGFAHMGVRCV